MVAPVITWDVGSDTGPPICSANATKHSFLNEIGKVIVPDAVVPETEIVWVCTHCLVSGN